MPERNTIVILSPGFPADEADTACLPAQQQLVRHLQEGFPEVAFMVLALQYPFKKETYRWNNVTVTSFNGRNRGRWRRLRLWYAVWRHLRRLRRSHKIQGLFSCWYGECALIGQCFGRLQGVPHFTWVLGQDAIRPNKYASWLRPAAGELVALSDFVAGNFEKHHRVRPQHTIAAGIDPGQYPQTAGERDIDVMGAGALIPLKQYKVFVDMIAAASKRLPRLRAVICGKGPEQAALLRQAEQLQLKKNIALPGETAYPGVLRLMQRSKVFLHTSAYEGLGMVCLEALYAGAHVISFCKPFERDIPHWHVVKDKQAMQEKLLELLHTPALDHTPVMPFAMKDTAAAVMKLFS